MKGKARQAVGKVKRTVRDAKKTYVRRLTETGPQARERVRIRGRLRLIGRAPRKVSEKTLDDDPDRRAI
jgi:hypothetical protein